jgi:hypothetical protein
LNLFVQVSPPRGIDTDENPTVSPELVEKAQRAMADVVERSLNRPDGPPSAGRSARHVGGSGLARRAREAREKDAAVRRRREACAWSE